MPKAEVYEVLFKNNYEAYGVKYKFNNEMSFALASKGVILSAGVIGTPKILMLSGIGIEEHLKEVNILPKINLPVGNNLQDHVTTGFALVTFDETKNFGMGLKDMINPLSAIKYFIHRGGPWTTIGCEVMGFLNTKHPNNTQLQPDLQFMVMPLGIEEDSGLHLRKLMGISDVSWSQYFSKVNGSISILPVLLHPKSKGTVRLNSLDKFGHPLIDPNYLHKQEDVDVLIEGIKIIKEFVKTEPMQELGAKFNTMPFPGCTHHRFDTKLYWDCYIRHLTITSYHPVGTCKMGDDEDSVINYNFQVKLTNKLYVVDSSILPTLTSGNINAAVLMMAEKASEVILNNEFLNKGTSKIISLFYSNYTCNIF